MKKNAPPPDPEHDALTDTNRANHRFELPYHDAERHLIENRQD